MIGVIVTIGPGENLDRQRASAVAEQEAPKFEGMDGLRSKVFMWDDETGTVTSTYVWDSEPPPAHSSPRRSSRRWSPSSTGPSRTCGLPKCRPSSTTGSASHRRYQTALTRQNPTAP